MQKIIKQQKKDKSWYHFINLKMESIITTFLTQNIPTNRLSSWHKSSQKHLQFLWEFLNLSSSSLSKPIDQEQY